MANEKRLIDGNGRYTLHAADNTGYSLLFRNGIVCVENELGHCVCEFHADDAPTVDAVPVAYGRWNKWRPPQNMVLIGVEMLNVCSECTAKYVQTFSYCPNCGAKMENEAHHIGFVNVDLED